MTQRFFYSEFRERRAEVFSYLAMLKLAERYSSDMAASSKRRREKHLSLLRATTLLILYNAIEASARSAIEAIYDEFSAKTPAFGDLKETIRRRIVSDFKNNVRSETGSQMRNIAEEIVLAGFDGRKIFSGNVDAREIRKVAERYDIDVTGSDFNRTMNGQKLVEVKDKRNDLAHGRKSFAAVGREYTSNDVIHICKVSLAFMDHVLDRVSDYLEKESFLEPAGVSASTSET